MSELSRSFTYPLRSHVGVLQPRRQVWFGLFRFRSPLLTESILFLFLRLLRCFTSPGIAYFLSSILFSTRRTDMSITTIRLPHSEISGSKCICHSPKLIAAYHVLHRLLAPRHPLCALYSLIPKMKSAVNVVHTACFAGRSVLLFNGQHLLITYFHAGFRKNLMYLDSNILSSNAKNGSNELTLLYNQKIISLHMDVKERLRLI